MRDRGQATVEFALCLPLVGVILLLMAQLLVVGLAKVQLVNATRDATRTAAVSAEPSMAVGRAVSRLGLDGVTTSVSTDAQWVTVTLRQTVVTDLPIVGSWIDDVELSQTLTMMREPAVG